jgi:hypothetical protein
MHPAIKIIQLFTITALLFSCAKASRDGAVSNESGKGGSLAKFTISGNYLYVVDNSNLYTYDISNSTSPVKTATEYVGTSIETIYPYKNRLFIGSRDGMFIYSIEDAAQPFKMGAASHARSCDPVVANDSIAFVTLKGNTFCGAALSGLYVHDVSNLFHPILRKTIAMESPEGLALQDTTLYICNNEYGLKIYNISDPYNPVVKNVINNGKHYRDVIPYNGILICYITTGIILFDINDPINPVELATITN